MPFRPIDLPLPRPTVVFDGVCPMCHGGVRFIAARDPGARFAFTPTQSPLGRLILERIGLDPDDPTSFVLVEDGGAYLEVAAMRRIGRHLTGIGPVAAWAAGWLPGPVGSALYRLIARNRHRISGRLDACPIPPPEWRERFLTEVP